MKFALIDKIKTEATKGAKGLCPNCSSELIARCGDYKVNHWAHKGNRNCDPWWENETEWHRAWKGNFTRDWQEVLLTDKTTGEKHIADVRTTNELVIEFQHSHISSVERTKREKFYKNMVWVVDGTRLKKDYPRFIKAKENFRYTQKTGLFLVDLIEECFPINWLESSVPVIFDFKGLEIVNDEKDWKNFLYCLFPKSNLRKSLVAVISRQPFIKLITTGDLYQELQKTEKEIVAQQPTNNLAMLPRSSQYVLNRGRIVKRNRF